MSEIDDYLAPLPSEQRAALAHVRAIVAPAAPDAAEGRSYGMPAFRLHDRPLVGFTANKQHLSLHPFNPDVVDAVRGDLEGFDLSKGTIRFTPERPVPDGVVEEIVARRRGELEHGD